MMAHAFPFNYEIIDHPRYKYRLTEETAYMVDIEGEYNHEFFHLAHGWLVVKKGYAWDGASGPAVDTSTFMRASCIHDALYQLMREGIIPRSNRKKADKIMRQIGRQDGMSKPRAWWVYAAVRLGAGASAKPRRA